MMDGKQQGEGQPMSKPSILSRRPGQPKYLSVVHGQPRLRLATNTEIYNRMRDDMDLNCGTIIDSGESVEACGQRIFDLILAVASGQRTCSEELDYGDNEFTPWQLCAVY